jgi:methylated-DNA-[protein]-cysteine S-methyltransferase
MSLILESAEFESPIGPITVAVRDGRLCALTFADDQLAQVRWLERRFGAITFQRVPNPIAIITALTAYFGGDLAAFDTIELDAGGTPFQARVWSELRKVLAGRTVSYGQLATRIGLPRAVRAVGAANGHNPIALVVPCHRVIGTDGRLVGYGGGLDRKRWLLRHEGALTLETSNLQLPLTGALAGPEAPHPRRSALAGSPTPHPRRRALAD